VFSSAIVERALASPVDLPAGARGVRAARVRRLHLEAEERSRLSARVRREGRAGQGRTRR